MTIVRRIAVVALAVLAGSCVHTHRAEVGEPMAVHMPNGAMEGKVGAQHLPPHWEPFVLGTAAAFATDASIKHGDKQSIRIEAKESARSYVWSDKIPCAPGEKIHAGCW